MTSRAVATPEKPRRMRSHGPRDLLELGCFGRVRERQAVRAVRRTLERELWP